MHKMNKIIYYFHHPGEFYEKVYTRLYLGVKNPAYLTVCSVKQNDIKKAYAAVRKLLAGKFDDELYSEIVECMDMIRESKPYETIMEKYDTVLSKLDKVPPKVFTGYRWCTIASVLCCNGLFRAEAVCREKSKQYFMSSRGNYAQKITISLENRNLETARLLIDHICRLKLWKYFMYERIQYYKFYYNMLGKKEVNPYSIDWHAIENADEDFRKYLTQKEVKIIGPTIKEIGIVKTNEYIVRMNSDETEVRKHIADAIYFRPEPFKKVFGGAEIVFKRLGKICVYDYDAANKKVRKKRITYAPNCIFYMRTMNTVQHILMDVLTNGASSVYIGGTTLFMSEKTHYAHYADYLAPKKDRDIFLRGLANHNLQSQFIFMQNLYQTGCFKADDTLHNILSLSVEEYLANMERLHAF